MKEIEKVVKLQLIKLENMTRSGKRATDLHRAVVYLLHQHSLCRLQQLNLQHHMEIYSSFQAHIH